MSEDIVPMKQERHESKPGFIRQGVLIVLPVVVLAGVGLFSLRQDKLLVQHEAMERAHELAEERAQAIWSELTGRLDTNAGHVFLVNRWGQLLSPSRFALTAEGVNSARTPEQSKLDDLRRALFESIHPLLVEQSNAVPPWLWFRPRVQAWGVTTPRGGGSRVVVPGVAREGAPQMTIVAHTTNQFDGEMTDVTVEPGPGRVPIATGESWLALRFDDPGGYWLVCWPETKVSATVFDRAGDTLRRPGYLGVSVELAGHPMLNASNLPSFWFKALGKGGGSGWVPGEPPGQPEILASARRGAEFLKVNAHLLSPQMLYVRQQARTRWFGLLIGAAVAAAAAGLAGAWRAFRRQQRLSEMKTNFVSSVSHELRAPIASVRLMAEGLARGNVTEPARQREYFHFIVQECDRLGTLINNVLDFSQMEQGRKQYEFEPTDVMALIAQTVKLMEPRAAERAVTLTMTLPEDAAGDTLQPVIDGRAVQQALINLLDNAIKHAPDGSTVSVALAVNAPASTFTLSVTDHGPGIPAAEHEKIFERFHRCGSELRRETPGVGLGLSIVRHAAAAHGGRVRVRSAVGEGSCFTMELPLRADEPDPVMRKEL